MQPFRNGSTLAIGAVLVAATVLVAAAGVVAALPALLGFALLFAGRYPGADRLERLISGRCARPAAYPVARRAVRPPTVSLSWRGGELIATSLAKRPPPALLGST
jgi:hypothetical protein